ncbi:unnamed protein product [Eretmochelys imbricata]
MGPQPRWTSMASKITQWYLAPRRSLTASKKKKKPQTELIHRRTSVVPETPTQDHIPKRARTGASKTVLPKKTNPASRLVKRNSQHREEMRQQANSTAIFQHEPAEIEQPEEQQPSARAATPWQATWMEELARTASFDLDLLVDGLTKDLSAEIVSMRKGTQENTPTAHRTPVLGHNIIIREARRRNISCCYDQAAGSRSSTGQTALRL